jgi:hypothetical protein
MQPLDALTEATSPLTGSVGKLVSASIARLPAQHLERAVDAIGGTLASAQVLTNLSASTSLLELVFGEDAAPNRASELSAAQRKALEYIAEYGAFEWDGHTFANYARLLGERGLPSERAKLRAWIGRREPPIA